MPVEGTRRLDPAWHYQEDGAASITSSAVPRSQGRRSRGLMKILQVHTRYRQQGGEDTVVRAEAELLRSLGHEVVQVEAHNPEGRVAAAAALALSPHNPRAAAGMTRVARRVHPDVAHLHNTWFAMSPAVAGALRSLQIPVVMTLHNYRLLCTNAQLFRDGAPCEDCVGSHPWHGVRHRCYRSSATASTAAAVTIAVNRKRWDRDVALFLALTDFARERFIAGGLDPLKVRVKPNFVVDPGPRSRPPQASDQVLYVGRLSHEKGVAELTAAWEAAAPDGLELLVIGDGPQHATLAASPPPGVRFVGRQPAAQVRDLMLGSRALVVPSLWYEGQPMVALEALAAGMPVVAADIGGLTELLKGSSAGWLAAPGSRPSWSTALANLSDDRAVERAGREARSLWARRYSSDQAARHLTDAYDVACRGAA